MKITVFAFVFIVNFVVSESKVLPEYLPTPLSCEKKTSNYEQCLLKVFKEWGPHLVKGIKQINFPKLSPLHVPLFMVNRTLNEQVSINAVIRDFKVSGFDTISVRSFRFNPINYEGNLHLNIAQLFASMQYDVKGTLINFSFENSGYFKSISTDIELLFDFKLKPVDRLGIKYFQLEYFNANSTIGNTAIKLTSKNPEFQPVADLLVNFVNENPRRALDIVQPIYAESVTYFYRGLVEDVLKTVPADEILSA